MTTKPVSNDVSELSKSMLILHDVPNPLPSLPAPYWGVTSSYTPNQMIEYGKSATAQQAETIANLQSRIKELEADKAITKSLQKIESVTMAQIEQILTDPENQPSQFGTVPLSWHESECASMQSTIDELRQQLAQQPSDTLIAESMKGMHYEYAHVDEYDESDGGAVPVLVPDGFFLMESENNGSVLNPLEECQFALTHTEEYIKDLQVELAQKQYELIGYGIQHSVTKQFYPTLQPSMDVAKDTVIQLQERGEKYSEIVPIFATIPDLAKVKAQDEKDGIKENGK